ncbi:hypothetical protein J4573_18490 [Actinomadura barringtoniae]|uniref:DUF5666 domain-containing protein n=1 Tax=Actinomadura barringtoniae TaxID=1427535 RepID=A0A939PG31_9ACTN|nr:DUF5666 domain-containing protein [Actinomadura barringtoniae]MBO2449099.1 hypothetical protein [Actinomadura barringtoniae]
MKLNAKTGVAAVGVAGLAGLGLYIAVPAAANPSPSPSSSSTASPHGKGDKGNKGGHGWRHGLRGSARGLHGEMTVQRNGKFLQVAWQRGQVTGRSGNVLTVRSEDGATWQWTTTGDTKVRKNRAKSATTDLANGDKVMVWGEQSGATRTAKLVRVPDPNRQKQRPKATPTPSHS